MLRLIDRPASCAALRPLVNALNAPRRRGQAIIRRFGRSVDAQGQAIGSPRGEHLQDARIVQAGTVDGGFEEFPELRDSRCSSLASFPARASLASISSECCPAISLICRSCAVICSPWRRTTTISSSRDISSGTGTRRSNRTPADHTVIDTPTHHRPPPQTLTRHDARG